MEYVKLGTSDVEVTRITFGAWAIGGWMWGGADRLEALTAIDAALDYGVTSIDTAPVYGFGRSEEIVGEAIKGKRDKVQILTKYGMRWNTTKGQFAFDSKDNEGKDVRIYKYSAKNSVLKECEASLKRLGTDYIDLYQIHWPDDTTPIDETMEAIEKLLKQGKIRAAGVCNYDAGRLDKARLSVHIVSNQVPYSMVQRDIEEELVPYCVNNNTSILAYSPLQRGLLTGKITKDYQFNDGDNRPGSPYFQEKNLVKINAFLDKIKPIADGKNASLAELAINWTLQQTGITVALVGARNPKQVESNVKALDFEITADEMNAINTELIFLNKELNL
ncbi:MAG: aldo/keto reductase [Bacteroidota bacterium]